MYTKRTQTQREYCEIIHCNWEVWGGRREHNKQATLFIKDDDHVWEDIINCVSMAHLRLELSQSLRTTDCTVTFQRLLKSHFLPPANMAVGGIAFGRICLYAKYNSETVAI